MLRHVPTRWSSVWLALKAMRCYFFTLAENCPVAVFKFVKDDKDEHDRLEVIKCLLDLFHNALNVSYDTILKLEWTDLVATEVYDMMNSLEGKLQRNIGGKLRGYKCSSSKNTSWQQQWTLFSRSVSDVSKYEHFHLIQSPSPRGGNRLHKRAKIVQKLNWNTLLRNTFYITR